MNDYSCEAIDQWIESSGVLDTSAVQKYQKLHELGYAEILTISREFFLKARQGKAIEGLSMQGFKPYYFYSSSLNQFEDLHNRIL